MLGVHPSPPAVAPRVCLVQPFPVIVSSTTRALSPTLRLSFVVALAVVLGSTVVAYRNSRRSMEMSASVAHGQEVRAELAKLLSDLEGAQERQRAIRLREGDDIEGARRLIAPGVSTNAMTRVRTTIARMERNETDLLAHRSRAVNGTARATTVTFVATAILGVTSLGVLFHLIRRYIVARERAAAERESLLAAERAARVEAEASRSQAEQARAEAEAANRAKDHFLALVSHELRSPLAGIRIWTKLLRRGTLGPQEAARALEVIERSTLLQMRLVADLLDVSRIVAGKLQLDYEDVDLAGTVRTALDLCRSSAGEKGVRLEEAFGPAVGLVSGDVARLQQVVWNLVANAIKFTPTGGRVEVQLERAHDALRLVVRDTGEGIAPALLPHVFEPFRQGDGTSTRRHGGLGLGLAIVRQLVHSHRGTVEAVSAGPGQGATFTVTLPLKTGVDAPVIPAEPERARYAVLDGVGVLVVDDDSGAREALAAALEQRGAELAQAAPPPVDTPA